FSAAVATGGFFLAVLFKTYGIAIAAAVAALAIFLLWSWRNGAKADPTPVDVGEGLLLMPHHGDSYAAPGRSGLLYTLLADATLFASLLFGFVYLWTIAPNWPPPEYISSDLAWPATGVIALAIAYAGGRRGWRRITYGAVGQGTLWMTVSGAG